CHENGVPCDQPGQARLRNVRREYEDDGDYLHTAISCVRSTKHSGPSGRCASNHSPHSGAEKSKILPTQTVHRSRRANTTPAAAHIALPAASSTPISFHGQEPFPSTLTGR